MDMHLVFLLVACSTFHRSTCTQWTSGPDDNAVLYTCALSYVSLPWTLLISDGDVIENIQWFFSGRSSELIATDVHGHFFTLPAFSGRVNQSTNVGIDVHHMQDLDTGNYSVDVLVRQASGDIMTLRRSAFVHVTDEIQISDKELHVNQLPVAEYNNQTDQYHVVLSCGNFTYPTKPPFLATWQTPSGRTLDSDKYDNNQFFLLLPNPVEGGFYICRVGSPSACLHGNNSKEGRVTVDKLEARLAVLEARSVGLASRNAELERQLRVKDVTIDTEINILKFNTTGDSRAVSFYAILSNYHHHVPQHNPLIFDVVVNNVGNAYDASRGVFTAPLNGSYFFVAKGEAGGSGPNYLVLNLMVNNRNIHTMQTQENIYRQSATIHGAVYLTTGQTAWVQIANEDNEVYGGSYCSFSGFLIH